MTPDSKPHAKKRGMAFLNPAFDGAGLANCIEQLGAVVAEDGMVTVADERAGFQSPLRGPKARCCVSLDDQMPP